MTNIIMVTRPICPPWDEASKNFAYDLARSVARHRFHLLTCGTLPNRMPNMIEHPIYSSPRLRLSAYQKTRLLAFLTLALPKKIDMLHFLFTPSPATTAIVKYLILPGRRNIKTIQTVATLDFKKMNSHNIRKYLFADIVVTHSEYSKIFLSGLGFSNVQRIYPGIDLNKFKPENKNAALMRQLNIPSSCKIILYTGEYARLNAIDLIISSLPIVNSSHPDFRIILACRIKSDEDIIKKKEVQSRIRQFGLDDKVIYLETFADMPKLYNMADLFIFPARNMAGKFDIALTVIEAMACGKPVILSDLKPLTEACQTQNCAITKPIPDASSLAASILKVLQNADLANTLGNNARRNVELFFDIKDRAEEYGELYDSVQ